ncbi:DUF443 family protein [Oceanobacillus halophilus]|nr:DUF443 family protein [Oceanobacillus halophilus]
MECEIQGAYKNLRYRILKLNRNTYILDMGKSFFKILFPFTFWTFPNTVYKINDEKIVEQLKAPIVKQTNTGYFSVLGAGLSILIANLISPLISYFDIQTSTSTNIFILVFSLILAILLRFYISHINQKNLKNVVELEQLEEVELWIRPKSIKYLFQYLFFYLFFLAFIIFGIAAFIEHGNVIILSLTLFFLFFLFIGSGLTISVGKTKVK